MSLFSRLLGGGRQLDEQLIAAVERCDLSEVRALLAKGASVNARDNVIHAPVIFAPIMDMPHNHDEKIVPVIECLLQAGANINARDAHDDNWTPLMMAASNNKPRTVERLIEMGADTSLRDGRGRTVLALVRGHNCFSWNNVLKVLAKKTAEGQAWLRTREGQEWMNTPKVRFNE